jgi:FkbM family methyltransferase
MTLTFSEQVKRGLPRPVRRAAGVSLVWAKRLSTWMSLLASVRGATQNDQRILNRSARRGVATAARDLDIWRAPVALEDVTVETKGVGRFRVRGDGDDLYHVWPGREPAVARQIVETLRPGDVFVDGGANMGFYTLLASKLVGSDGRVYAVEMIPETAERLRAHVADNGLTNVTVIERALSAREGETVHAAMPQGRWGMASIVRGDSTGSRDIATTTLDAILKDEPRVRLIKLDLEGAEPLALAGATETLRKTEQLVFERAPDAADDRDLVATFVEAGLQVRPLDSTNAVAIKGAA